MSQSKYIKVTPKGEKEGRVVLDSLKSFFVSQGAKIETPTQEEIEAAFPEERKDESRFLIKLLHKSHYF